MTREEITQEIEDLSQKLFQLGKQCDAKAFEDPARRAVYLICGEFLMNSSFTMDTVSARLREE